MPADADSLYMLNLSEKGTFAQSGVLRTRPEDVDDIFDYIRSNEVSHLVLHFHGGLISEDAGRLAAERLRLLYEDRVGAHPVFFVWESSWQEIIRGRLEGIAQLKLFSALRETVINFALRKQRASEEGRSALSMLPLVSDAEVAEEEAQEFAGVSEVDEAVRDQLQPVTDVEIRQFKKALRDRTDFRQEAVRIEGLVLADTASRSALAGGASSAAGTLEDTMLSDDLLKEFKEQFSKEQGRVGVVSSFLLGKAVSVFRHVVERMISRTDHGTYCTVIEEILRQFYGDKLGGALWQGMKAKIQAAFADNTGLSGDELHGGTYFLGKLRDYLADAPVPLKVSLVGHSAGAIYVCRLLNAARDVLDPSFRFYRVLFLAPAVDFELFERAVVDQPNRFDAFRIYAMSDYYEARDKMVPVLYPRSLLYFVSGLLEGNKEKTLVGMERFYSGKPPYDQEELRRPCRFVLEDGKNRVVWAVKSDAGEGLNSDAQSHGGFAMEPVTQTSLIHLLRA